MNFPISKNENERLNKLADLHVLDSDPELIFDRYCVFAKEYFDVAACALSLIDEDRQWFKAECGLDIRETPRELAFCNYTILSDEVVVVEDAAMDPRFSANPFVEQEPFVRFYAGAPLIIGPEIRAGSICLIDTKSREFSDLDQATLKLLADRISTELMFRALAIKRARMDEHPLLAECGRPAPTYR
jgi:GAF domain-containing protein